MNPSRLFIERPVATTLLMVALLLAGCVAYRLLPVAALPQVDYPTIQVTTLYPGAGPEVMTSGVTAPLERQFGQMPGLAQMYFREQWRLVRHHPALYARYQPGLRGADGAGGHERGIQSPARGPAESAGV